MGRQKKGQVEQQKSCLLTWQIKMHILRFKSKNIPLDRGAEYLSAWTTKLAEYLLPKNQRISRKDVERWVNKYPWITSPNPLEVEPKSHAIRLRREKNLDLNVTARSDIESDDEGETPTRCLGKRHNNNNNPNPASPIIIKSTGIIGNHELRVTFENGVTIYNNIWTKVVGTDSFVNQNTPSPSHSAHSFVNQNTPSPSHSAHSFVNQNTPSPSHSAHSFVNQNTPSPSHSAHSFVDQNTPSPSPSHSANSHSSQPMDDPLNTANSNAEETTTLPHIDSEVEDTDEGIGMVLSSYTLEIPHGGNNNPGDNYGNNSPPYYDSIESDEEDGQFPPIDVNFGYGNGEFFKESVNLDSNLRSDLKSQPAKINVVTLKARNDKDFTPMTAKLTQAQPVNVESSQSQPSTINQQSVPIANNVTTNTAISAPVVPSTSVSNDADIQSSPNNRPKTKKIPKANKHKQLPPDAATKHPVSLLNEMHNVINQQYTYYECFQERKIIGYRAELTVTLTNGTEKSFLSTAICKKKKDAKRFAAEKACNQLWQLTYPEEEVEGIAAIKEACENHAKLIVLPSQALSQQQIIQLMFESTF